MSAPDLPGHGTTPAPPGGAYELMDAAVHALPLLGDRPVVVGVGVHGWSAQVLALGGQASALVLVDGLGGPWMTVEESVDRGRRWLRAIADDAEAVAPAPATGLDPRLRHGVPGQASRALAQRAASAVEVPVLVIESSGSSLSIADRRDLLGRFVDATLVELPVSAPPAVAAAITDWSTHLSERDAADR